MATGVERLKADETVGKTDPDTLLSETDELHIDKDMVESELGGPESDDHGINKRSASSGAHSAHVDLTELVENVDLTGLTAPKSAEVNDTNSDVKDQKQSEKEDEDFFEARLGLDQEPSENIIPETDLVPEAENTNVGQLGETMSETKNDAKMVDIVNETESYNRTNEDRVADNEFNGSSQTEHSASNENDFHADSNRTADEHARVSAYQAETVNEVHVGHIRGSAEAEDGSESSDTEAEYESADEGEEIQMDAEQLKDLEESLTEEQKEERRNSAQVLKEEGNELFRCGSYKSAIKIYSRALRTCPLKFAKDRAIMYSNRAVCKMKLTDNEAAIRDCSKALDLHPHYMKALTRRAELYEKTEKLDEALTDYQKIVELDPSQHSARVACMRLPEQIKDRNEKMKEEMMDKLKDLGNLILRPFGLSTNNFQLNQNPDSGGYSVNFVQNPEQ